MWIEPRERFEEGEGGGKLKIMKNIDWDHSKIFYSRQYGVTGKKIELLIGKE